MDIRTHISDPNKKAKSTHSFIFAQQEAKYRSMDEEEEKKKKLQLSKMSKYKKVVYWFRSNQAKNCA